MKGKLIVISSPSGGGKGTLIREVRKMMPELGFSVSHTTRPQRAGEDEGREYFFVARDEFQRRIDAGDFLEHADVHGNLYGTSIAESEKAAATGTDLIVEIDVQGAVQIMDKVADSIVSIFILPPSLHALETRLTGRKQDSAEVIAKRLQAAQEDIAHVAEFDYVIINDILDEALQQLNAIVVATGLRRERQLARQANFINLLQKQEK